MLQNNQYQKLIKTAKFAILLATSVFIFYKLVYRYKINSLFHQFSATDHTASFVFLAFAIILVFANWGLESLKWKWLIGKYETVSLALSFKAVLSGVCLSIVTPNQIGDFAGRVIHLQVLNKIKGSLITVIGHTAQVLITCFFGLFALWYLGNSIHQNQLIGAQSSFLNKLPNIQLSQFWSLYIPLLFVFLMGLSIWIYLNLQSVYAYFKRFAWLVKFEKYVQVFEAYSPKELFGILCISFFRYLVFLLQYYLLLVFFDVQIAPLSAVCCIIATFCVQSVVPSFFLLEIGLRGASALWFFGMFSSQTPAILMAAYSLWIINMMVPALMGMWFIYKVK